MKQCIQFVGILIFSCSFFWATAQSLQRGISPVGDLEQVAVTQLPFLDNERLKAYYNSIESEKKYKTFAEKREVHLDVHNDFTATADGNYTVLRHRVVSPGAYSLNFGFTAFTLPDKARLMIYTPDKRIIQGPYTPEDNDYHAQLWTPIIESDDVVIELIIPTEYIDETELVLTAVNHDFTGVSEAISQSCNVDVICSSEDGLDIVDNYRDIIRSVATYTRQGIRWCSGFLVNNTAEDCRPLFMTAEHCGMNDNTAPSMVIYWNYENTTCRTPGSAESGRDGDGDLTDTNTGAELLADWAATDVTMLLLDDPVSPTANDFRAGWNATLSVPDTMICIHHPNTEEKRISFDYDPGRFVDETGSADTITNTHVLVADYDLGSTEGGSSGSPLFDQNKRVIGQLTGGSAACGNDLEDIFGSIFRSWEGNGRADGRIKDYLDPLNSGTLILDGRDCGLMSFFIEDFASVCAPDVPSFSFVISDRYTDPVTVAIRQATSDLEMEILGGDTHNPGDTITITPINSTFENIEYSFIVAVTGNGQVLRYNGGFNINNDIPTVSIKTAPADESMNIGTRPVFTWQNNPTAETYRIEIINNRTDEVIERFTSGNSLLLDIALDAETFYTWNVYAENACGTQDMPDDFRFRTGNIACIDKPIITESSASISTQIEDVTLALNVDQAGSLESINAVTVEIDHSYIGDLSAVLVAPDGRIINLFNRPQGGSCSGDDLRVTFSDDAAADHSAFVNTCNGSSPSSSGTFKPAQALSTLNGADISGEWSIILSDNARDDGGTFLSWSLDFCAIFESTENVSIFIEDIEICPELDTVVVPIELLGNWGDDENITLSFEPLPDGAILRAIPETFTINDNPSLSAYIAQADVYPIEITATGDQGNTATLNWTLRKVAEERVLPPEPAYTPIDTVSAEDLTFVWPEIDGVDRYRLTVSRDSFFTDIYILDEFRSGVVIDTFDNTLGNTYFWRIEELTRCNFMTSRITKFTIGELTNNEEITDNKFVSIYPNPSFNTIQFENVSSSNLIDYVEILNINGSVIRRDDVNARSWVLQHQLPSGVYLARVHTQLGVQIERITVVQ